MSKISFTKKPHIKLALAIAAFIVLWLLSGIFKSDSNYENDISLTKTKSATVRVKELEASEMIQKIQLYGVTEAFRKSTVRSEISGKVKEIVAKEGAKIGKCEPIINFDIRDQASLLKSAESKLKKAEIELETSKKLMEAELTSKVMFQQAKAGYDAAKADYENAKLNLKNTSVKSPFAGFVEKIYVEEGDYVNINGSTSNQIASIIDLSKIIVTGDLSEADVNNVSIGDKAKVRVSGKDYIEGEVIFVSSVANTNTRSFKIEILVDNPSYQLLDGLSADIAIETGRLMAHLVPSSSLTLNEYGEVGIKIIVNGDQVEFHKAEIVAEEDSGFWLQNLPKHIKLITVGHGYVSDGDKVIVSYEE